MSLNLGLEALYEPIYIDEESSNETILKGFEALIETTEMLNRIDSISTAIDNLESIYNYSSRYGNTSALEALVGNIDCSAESIGSKIKQGWIAFKNWCIRVFEKIIGIFRSNNNIIESLIGKCLKACDEIKDPNAKIKISKRDNGARIDELIDLTNSTHSKLTDEQIEKYRKDLTLFDAQDTEQISISQVKNVLTNMKDKVTADKIKAAVENLKKALKEADESMKNTIKYDIDLLNWAIKYNIQYLRFIWKQLQSAANSGEEAKSEGAKTEEANNTTKEQPAKSGDMKNYYGYNW